MHVIIVTLSCNYVIIFNALTDFPHYFLTLPIRYHKSSPNILVIRVVCPFFITVIYYVIYIRVISPCYSPPPLCITLFIIINKGFIAIQTSAKVLTSKYSFQ